MEAGAGLVFHFCSTSLHKCEAVPRRARIQGSWTFVSLNSRRASKKEEEKDVPVWIAFGVE